MANSSLRTTMLEVAETWERLALLDEQTVIPPSVSHYRPLHLVGLPGGRIKTYRDLAAITRAVAKALSDPKLRTMVLGDAEMWDRMADFEE